MTASLLLALLLAADAAAATPPPKAKKQVHPDAIVCKNEKVVGSSLPVRVCMPQWQWEERRTDDSEMLSKGQRNQPKIF